MPELVLKNIRKTYPGGKVAISGLDLTVRDGEFLVLAGPENCGKTTLLRMIAGLEDMNEGEMILDGKSVGDVSVKNRDFAMLFQNQTIYSHLSVYDNIAYGLQIRKVPKEIIDPKVKRAAEIFGLTDLLARKPKLLSSIQRQRVALCRMIVREPKIILLDEPLSGLDEKLRPQMKSELIQLHARFATTVIYAAQDPAEALMMGTRIAVLKDGGLQQVDTPQNLYDSPANTFVADYIGRPSINFFKNAALVSEGEKTFAKCAEGMQIAIDSKLVKQIKNITEYLGTSKPVTVGVRPEDVELSLAADQENGFTATVTASESYGGKVIVTCASEGGEIKAFASSALQTGGELNAVCSPEHVYIFDGETGETLFRIGEN